MSRIYAVSGREFTLNDMRIAKGDKGDKGDRGDRGDKGDKGDKWGDELITLVDDATDAANSAAYNANATNAIAIDLVDNLTNQTIDFVNDAINNTAIEGGVLAATFVTVEEQITGEGALNLRDFNSRTILTVNSMTELLQVKSTTGRTVFVKGLQGGTFVYDSSKSTINDGGYIFNGWVRKLDYSKVTPEMFGAKGDGVTDDADAIRRCVASCLTNKIKSIIFSRSYLIDTPRIVGQETLLIMSPNISYVGVGGAEFVVGDNIPDKFIIFGAVHNIITTPDVGNVIVSGIKFRANSSAANMTVYSSNLAIHTFGLNNVWIEKCTFDDLDLSNVIACGLRYEGVDYGSNCVVENNRFLSVVAENPVNIDHSSVYMEAPNSVVRNNHFISKTVQNRKVACCVEIHASNVKVHDNYFNWYSRFVWFAAQPKDVIDSHVTNNIGKVSNHLAILTSSSTARVAKCSIKGNYVRCEHATGEANFNTYQGLAVTSGLLDPLGWQAIGELLIEDNDLFIDLAVDANHATIVNFDQEVSAMIKGNTVYGAVAGINVISLDNGGGFVDNNVYNQLSSKVLNKDFFLDFKGTSLNTSSITGNKFSFKAENKPAYLIGFAGMVAGGLISTAITKNKYLSNIKPQADLFFQSDLGLSGYGNVIDAGIYNLSLSIPALSAGQDAAWTQPLPNNFNGMIIDCDIIADSRFYPLVAKTEAVGSNVNLRVKGITTNTAFSLPLANVRVKTK